jgi:hypothetical protein
LALQKCTTSSGLKLAGNFDQTAFRHPTLNLDCRSGLSQIDLNFLFSRTSIVRNRREASDRRMKKGAEAPREIFCSPPSTTLVAEKITPTTDVSDKKRAFKSLLYPAS